jgi:hypothetical protein
VAIHLLEQKAQFFSLAGITACVKFGWFSNGVGLGADAINARLCAKPWPRICIIGSGLGSRVDAFLAAGLNLALI